MWGDRGEINPAPEIRSIRAPLTRAMLAPLEKALRTVQFAQPFTEAEFRQIARLLESRPNVCLRDWGDSPNLEFLEYFPNLRHFQVDGGPELQDLSGLNYLLPEVESLSISLRRSRPLSLTVLTRFSRLRTLYLEGPVKDIDVIAELTSLEDLTMRSITLPNLRILTPLRRLLSLDIKLGGTRDLSDLPNIGRLRYLELWMVRGLTDLAPIGGVKTLQFLRLQALRRVDRLPALKDLTNLRRVILETMKGVRDPCALAEAPALEELFMIDMGHMQPDDFKCLVGHPSLRYAAVGLGSTKKNEAVHRILRLPDPPPTFQFR